MQLNAIEMFIASYSKEEQTILEAENEIHREFNRLRDIRDGYHSGNKSISHEMYIAAIKKIEELERF